MPPPRRLPSRNEHRVQKIRQRPKLKAIIERIERLGRREKTISTTSATSMGKPGHGFDVQVLRTIVGCASQDDNERAEQEPYLGPICRRWGCCEALDRHRTLFVVPDKRSAISDVQLHIGDP